MKKNILIVGGTGFFGYHLLKFFLRFKWNVFSLSKSPPNNLRKLKNIRYLYGDISKAKKIEFLKDFNFNYIINCGGYVDHINKIRTFNTHFIGCKNLYKIFANKKIETFVQIGSSSEYGKSKSPLKETQLGKAKTIYGKSKLKASNFLLSLKNRNFPFVIIRPFLLYGPYQDNNRFLPLTISSFLAGKKFPCSDCTQYRDFLYIDDAVRAIKACLGNKKIYRKITNIGFGKPIQLRKAIKIIQKKIKKGKPDFGKIALRSDEPEVIYPDIKRAKKYLDWKPAISFQQGIIKTINYFKKNSHSTKI
jgi:nucleoside-diphosphate-sugar epimerase